MNHHIIHQLDSHLYGHYSEDTPALFSYWESVFHVDNDLNFPYNARDSTYQSFLRLGLACLYEESKGGGGKCEIPREAVVKKVTVLMVKDIFRGLVVTLRDAMSDRLSPPEFEVLFSLYEHLQKYTVNSEVAKRIWGFEVRGEYVRDWGSRRERERKDYREVSCESASTFLHLQMGTDWDGKESMFCNYSGIIGVWDEPVAAVRMSVGKVGEVNIVCTHSHSYYRTLTNTLSYSTISLYLP